MIEAGRMLGGRFRVERRIGEGGWGTVVVATDMTIGRPVAIKTLHSALAEDPSALERFREEAFSLANVHHPNIVQLFDFQPGASEPFLVMEMLQGETLAQRIKREPRFPVDVAIDLAQQLLSGLAAAHAKGIIHRDVKPENIVLVPVPPRRELVKILDFGIAKLTEETIRRKPTTAGMLLGTPSYMAPEQTGGGAVDARTDVYAAGMVLYAMLAGRNPFAGLDLAVALVQVQQVVPPSLHTIRSDVPLWLSHAVDRALAKIPTQRFQSALEFAAALDNTRAAGSGATLPLGAAHAAPHYASHPPAHGASGAPMGIGAPSAPPYAPPPQAPAVGSAMPQATTAWPPPAPTSSPAVVAPPSASGRGPLVAAVIVMGVLLVAGVGVIGFLYAKQSEPAEAPTKTPAIASPTTSSAATASASAAGSDKTAKNPSTHEPSTAGAATTSPTSARGSCLCIPLRDQFTDHHGSNQPLADRYRLPKCRCRKEVGLWICSLPPTGCDTPAGCACIDSSTEYVGAPGAACEGFQREDGKRARATLGECGFSGGATYAGPTGRPCQGFSVDNKLLNGLVDCR